MNPQFRQWLTEGKAIEALCGEGIYFTPDLTYRDEHDFVSAVGALLEWAKEGHSNDAASALLVALFQLLNKGRLESALRLLRSYFVLQRETATSLPLDTNVVAIRISEVAIQAGERLSRDENTRNLLLTVSQDLPALRTRLLLV